MEFMYLTINMVFGTWWVLAGYGLGAGLTTVVGPP